MLAIFGTIGTATNSAIQKYLNQKQIPQLFVIAGATKWGDPKNFPWTIGWTPPYKIEAEIYADYIRKIPDAKIAEFFSRMTNTERTTSSTSASGWVKPPIDLIVQQSGYEVSDPTIKYRFRRCSEASGANVLLDITTPRFSALAIRGVKARGWDPVHVINLAGTSISGVLTPAGIENAKDLVSSAYLKDPSDAVWANDPEMKDFKAFFEKTFPSGNADIATSAAAYSIAATMEQVLRQCGDDLTRENVMRQAVDLKNFKAPLLLPSITINRQRQITIRSNSSR